MEYTIFANAFASMSAYSTSYITHKNMLCYDVMKRHSLLRKIGLLLAIFAIILPASHVSAASQDATIASVGDSIDGLWQYVDNNSNLPDEQFYPEFAKKAGEAENQAAAVYEYLGTVKEKDEDVAVAVATIRDDIASIRDQLGIWRQAALDEDSYSFESANSDLGDMVDKYNHDIDAYNALKYAGKSINAIAGYTGIPALCFMATALLFAWALYKNQEEDDPLQEAIRQLRWRVAVSMAAVFGATLIPMAVYFSAQSHPTWLLWMPTFIALAALFYFVGTLIRVWVLGRRYN